MSPSRIPVYMQIVDTLSERIEQGDAGPGDRMATERALAESFGLLDLLSPRESGSSGSEGPGASRLEGEAV